MMEEKELRGESTGDEQVKRVPGKIILKGNLHCLAVFLFVTPGVWVRFHTRTNSGAVCSQLVTGK